MKCCFSNDTWLSDHSGITGKRLVMTNKTTGDNWPLWTIGFILGGLPVVYDQVLSAFYCNLTNLLTSRTSFALLESTLHCARIDTVSNLSSTYSCLAVRETADSWLCLASSLCCWRWSRSDCVGSEQPPGVLGNALWVEGKGPPFSCSGLCPPWKSRGENVALSWSECFKFCVENRHLSAI